MSRMRSLAGVTLLAAAALLVPAAAASGAAKLAATIICDAETGIITTSVAGPLVQAGAPRAVTVEFQRRDSFNVSTEARSVIPPLATPFKVTVSTASNGSVRANGYTSSFAPATSFFYQETVVVTLRNAAGGVYAVKEATCKREVRTTVTLDCDVEAGSVTAAVRGTDGLTGGFDVRPARVRYQAITTTQAGPDEIRWSSGILGWEYDHALTAAADGTWTDTGYTKAASTDIYYSAHEVRVGVFNRGGQLVGEGSTKCVLADHSTDPQG